MAKKPVLCDMCEKEPRVYGISHGGKHGSLCKECIKGIYEDHVKKIFGVDLKKKK